MKILICGANGFVGKDLVYFLSKKHRILATYRNNKKTYIRTIILNGLNVILKIKLILSLNQILSSIVWLHTHFLINKILLITIIPIF